ncbi:hypothetical protein EPUL_001133, partial [Erysiphe pulchra]
MLARSYLRFTRHIGVSTKRQLSSSTAEISTPVRLNVAGSVATAVAIGSAAWYYHLFGEPAWAMTPAEEGLHPIKYPWEHEKWHKTFDHQALVKIYTLNTENKGQSVITANAGKIVSAEDSKFTAKSLVGVTHTVDEAKALAEENEYDTEPNDQGEIEKRPGKLSDYIPSPYKNDEAARAANNAGVKVQDGLNFNPYFPGTGIGMARVLYNDLVDYEDGTPATSSQMAKDVVEFLNWAAEPEMDVRKKMGVKVILITSVLFALSIWVKRYKWAPIKTRKIVYAPPKVNGPG